MTRNVKRRIVLFSLLSLALLAVLLGAAWPRIEAQASNCQASYMVHAGDTLGAIADKYNASIDDLTKANRLYAPYYTIYVNQKLCIPSGAKPLSNIPKFANALAADYTARINGKTLAIQTKNFPKGSGYYVKVGPAGSVPSQKIGMFNTASGGSLSFNFALPEKLSKAAQVSVCLKNNSTDANVCRLAKR